MKTESTALYGFGGTVKALGGGRVAGIGVPFNAPDCVFDVFNEQTKLGLEDRLAVPILYSHGFDPIAQDEELGKIKKWEMRSDGWWIEGQLNLKIPYAVSLYEMAQSNELGWSSAATGHLITRRPQSDGTNLLLKWLISEWSLTTAACSDVTAVVAYKDFKHVSLTEALRWHALTPGQRLREKGERLLRKIQGRGPTAAELRETSRYFQSRVARNWQGTLRDEARQYRQQRAKEHACTCHSKPKAEPQIVTVDHNQRRRDYQSELTLKYAGHVYADLEIRKALERFDLKLKHAA